MLSAVVHSELRPPAEPPPALIHFVLNVNGVCSSNETPLCIKNIPQDSWILRLNLDQSRGGYSKKLVLDYVGVASPIGSETPEGSLTVLNNTIKYKPVAPFGLIPSGLARDHKCKKDGAYKHMPTLSWMELKRKYVMSFPFGTPCSLKVDPSKSHESCNDSKQLWLIIVEPLLQWASSMGRNDSRLTDAMLTLALNNAGMCWRKRHFDRGKEALPYRQENVTSTEAQDKGWTVLPAVRRHACYHHLRVLMGSRLAHCIIYLGLALFLVLALVSTTMVHCHEGRVKVANPSKDTMALATVDACVDHVVNSATCAIAPITTAIQLRDLQGFDHGVDPENGEGLYTLRLVMAHVDPPPPPEPPPWINRSPSNNVEDPTSNIADLLDALGDVSLCYGELLWIAGIASASPVPPYYVNEWTILGDIPGEHSLAYGFLSSTHRYGLLCRCDCTCSRS